MRLNGITFEKKLSDSLVL